MGILIRVFALLFVLLLSVNALAQSERARARALADEAYEKYEGGHYAEANELFREADALHHAPTLSLWIARSYEKLQQLVKAEAAYLRLISEPLPKGASKEFTKAREEAMTERDALAPRIPHIQLGVPDPIPDDLRATLDGTAIERAALSDKIAVDPGAHEIVVRRGDEEVLRRDVDLGEGESMVIEIPEPQQPAGGAEGIDWLLPTYVAAGVTGAGLVIGLIGGGVALSRKSDLDERCVERSCPAEDQATHDSMLVAATASTAGFIITVVGAAATTVFVVLHFTSESEDVSVGVSPSGAHIEVQF